MSFIEYEKELEDLQRRIKKIKDNPDPKRMKSNLVGYELERDLKIDLLTALRDKRPLISSATMYTNALLPAMGFTSIDRINMVNRRSGINPAGTLKRLQDIRAKGFPRYCCDGVLMNVEDAIGNPFQGLTLLDSGQCEAGGLGGIAVSHFTGSDLFSLDIPLNSGEKDLQYVTEQLREFIEYAEKNIPGIKYDEDKLIELQELNREAMIYLRDTYEMRKKVPCPIPARDALRIPRLPSNFPDPKKALDWIKMWRDEIQERADKHSGNVSEEKLRFLWMMTAPMYRNVFTQCEERGVSVVWIQTGFNKRLIANKPGIYGDITEYGRKLTPLEEEARMATRFTWWGLGERWINDALDTCRDLKIDGIVNFLQLGCVHTLGLQKLLADTVEKELNIPTLQINGAYHDSEYVNDTEFDAELQDFINMCLAGK